jgi:hypothetical protein
MNKRRKRAVTLGGLAYAPVLRCFNAPASNRDSPAPALSHAISECAEQEFCCTA